MFVSSLSPELRPTDSDLHFMVWVPPYHKPPTLFPPRGPVPAVSKRRTIFGEFNRHPNFLAHTFSNLNQSEAAPAQKIRLAGLLLDLGCPILLLLPRVELGS